MDKKDFSNVMVVGFALFSMFFGAGNMIFPPYIGMGSAPHWFLSFACFYAADVGLAILTVFAIMKSGGDVDMITGHLGRVPWRLVTVATIICVGPLLAMPRTGAATFELAVVPFFGGGQTLMLITSVVYFGIVLALTVKESSVVDIVWKFLTPALLLGLAVLIVKGVADPVGPLRSVPLLDNIIAYSVKSGYQTMDMLASLAFAIIIVKSAAQKGYDTIRTQTRFIGFACAVAATGLMLVYGGLAYLGATASTMYDLNIGTAHLLTNIINQLVGTAGLALLGVVTALACITTAVALLSSSAAYFVRLSGGRIKYKTLCVIISILCVIISSAGLTQIVNMAGFVLSVFYPGVLVLVVLSFFSDRIKHRSVYLAATLSAMAVSVLEIINGYGVAQLNFVQHLPLAHLGFAWVAPAALCGVLVTLVKDMELMRTMASAVRDRNLK